MGKHVTVNLPDIGEGVVEGEVVEWLKKVGDRLGQDEPVVVVMTDKATVELPAPYPGILAKQYFQVGELAILDRPLYDIEVEGEVEIQHHHEEKKFEAPVEVVKERKESCDKALASPAVRQLAKQLGVDLAACTATGPHGEVTKEDVKALYTPKGVSQELPPLLRLSDDIEEPLVGVQRLMAEAMRVSHQEIPHFTLFDRIDVEALTAKKDEMKDHYAKKGVRLTLMPFYLYALSKAISAVPYANATLDMVNRRILTHQKHNIGIAMNAGHGLIVPVLKGVEKMDFDQLVTAYEELKKRALESRLSSSDMKEGTISLTNFGTLGGLAGTPIIPFSQTAIMGLGKIEKEPVVVGDRIEIHGRQMVCCSFDHRIVDGAAAASFVSAFIQSL